jgi:hypothetical protein
LSAAGLGWISRFHDTSSAIVFFGDRVAETDFSVLDGPLPLGFGDGLARIMELAEDPRILITS